MAVKAIPDGYTALTPYLIVDGAAKAIEFYRQAFGGIELMRMAAPGDRIGHAEMKLNGANIMLADEYPEMGHRGPKSIGGSPVNLMLYVDAVDEVFARAIELGAKETRAVADQFYGDRNGIIEDPFGHVWTIATHVEDVPEDEMARRVEEAMKKEKAAS